jgi:hypothetical protein
MTPPAFLTLSRVQDRFFGELRSGGAEFWGLLGVV